MKNQKTKKVKGLVIKGSGDGKKLGFPTINVRLSSPIDLDYGVYACKVILDGEFLNGVMHYGPRLVFNEVIPKFEVHIIDFDRDIYGNEVEVDIYKKIRGTQNFDSLDKLIVQMNVDLEAAKIFLKTL